MKIPEYLDKIDDIDKSVKSINNNLDLFKQIFGVLIGFLLSVSNICGEISPFGVSICSISTKETSLATSIGALFGYLVSGGNNMIYIIAVFLMLMVRWLFNDINIYSSIMTFLSLIASSFIFMIIGGNISFYNILIYISQALMAAGAAFFFCYAKKLLNHKTYYKGLNTNELATLLIAAIIMLTTFMSINFKTVSLGNILSIYLILFVALNMDASSSAVVGMMIGLAVLLSGNENNGFVILSYGLGGFLAGLAQKYKSIGVTSVFFVINGLISIFVSIISDKNGYACIIELLVASILFIITNKILSDKIALVKDNNVDVISCENAKNLMLSKLSFASNTLSDIAITTQKLSDKLTKNSQPTIDDVYHSCAMKICNQCKLKMFCWNTAYNDVVNSFNDMTQILKSNCNINEDNISLFLKNKCLHLNEIIDEVNKQYNIFISNKSINRKVTEIRNVVTDQFDGMAYMLKDLAKEFYEISQFDRQASIKAKRVLSNMGLNVYAITSFTDKYGRLTIEATTNVVKDVDYIGKSIAIKLSDICEKDFGFPSFIKVNKNMKLTIIEKATYEMDFGVTQLSCNNTKDCGDSYNYFIDSKGRAYMILSDGMGTGSRAAIDGAMTTGLLSKLIKAGFDFEAASKIVNAALLVKSNEESLSTIDVTSVNLYTGQMNIFKAGAAPTFTKKSDKVFEFDCSTLPAGILRGVSFDKKTVSLNDKDVIVMVSDGVTNNEYDWIYNEIKSFKYNITAKELSRKIALESKFRNKSNHDDDVTVMVGIILKGV